jgi:hypothetical protein
MAVDQHPSRRPSPPRRPPPTSTTDGQPNTVAKTGTGDGMMTYGSRNGKNLQIGTPHKSERAHDFTSSEGRAKPAGREEPQEGPKKGERASKSGDEE